MLAWFRLRGKRKRISTAGFLISHNHSIHIHIIFQLWRWILISHNCSIHIHIKVCILFWWPFHHTTNRIVGYYRCPVPFMEHGSSSLEFLQQTLLLIASKRCLFCIPTSFWMPRVWCILKILMHVLHKQPPFLCISFFVKGILLGHQVTSLLL